MTAVEQQQQQQLDETTARQLVQSVRTTLLALDADVARLYHGGAAAALGYGAGAKGWAALCKALFYDVQWLRPTPAARLERVAELRRQELSTRAIGDALGVSAATVTTDLRKLRDRGEQLPATVTSLDSYRRSATQPEQPAPAPRPQLPDLPLTELMRTALEQVWLAGDAGLSCLELEDALHWRHGRTSSLLHRLERAELVRLRADVRRDGYGTYVATLPAS